MSAAKTTVAGAAGAICADRAGVASIEFGILFPVLTVLVMGMTDLSLAIIKYRLLNDTVQQTGLMATELAVQPNQDTTLTVAQLNTASSVIFAIFPGLSLAGVYNKASNPMPPFAVTVSDIVFTPSKKNCTAGLDCTDYTANLAWSVPLQYGQQLQRPCGAVTQISASAPPVIVGGIPVTISTAGITKSEVSLLVVDGMYQFTPIFARFLGPITMRQSAYFNQRSVVAQSITYNKAGDASGGTVCTGVS